LFYVNTANLLYPTQFLLNDDDVTLATSNVSTHAVGSYKAHALSALLQNKEFAGAMFWQLPLQIPEQLRFLSWKVPTLSISAAQHTHSK
jgi:hypothetical protein